jgi:hypothetical protein
MQRSVDEMTWDRIVPVVIMIVNDPQVEPKDQCGEKIDGRDESCKARKVMNELLSPPLALMNTRGARASYARDLLRSMVTETSGEKDKKYRQYWMFSLEQNEKNKKPLPLGWVLSEAAKENMHLQLNEILKELNIMDSLIIPRTSQGGGPR